MNIAPKKNFNVKKLNINDRRLKIFPKLWIDRRHIN